VLHRNFTTFLVADGLAPRAKRSRRSGRRSGSCDSRPIPSSPRNGPEAMERARRPQGQRRGHGFFEYRLPWPEGLGPKNLAGASLVFEASAKQLFGKDRAGATADDGDFMRGKGTHDPGSNPNSYPMTEHT